MFLWWNTKSYFSVEKKEPYLELWIFLFLLGTESEEPDQTAMTGVLLSASTVHIQHTAGFEGSQHKSVLVFEKLVCNNDFGKNSI